MDTCHRNRLHHRGNSGTTSSHIRGTTRVDRRKVCQACSIASHTGLTPNAEDRPLGVTPGLLPTHITSKEEARHPYNTSTPMGRCNQAT